MATVDITVRKDGKREEVTISNVHEILTTGDNKICVAGDVCSSFDFADIDFMMFRDDSVRSKKRWTCIYRGGVN